MSAAWREGEPVDVWRAFRRLHFETDWEQLTGEQADEPVLRALETGDVWQPKLIQPGGTALWKGPAGRGARKASALLDARVDALIKQRREAPDPAAVDQLSRLVRQAAEDGVTTDEQIRATVKLQFPDPIHDFLTWIFWALARNPDVEERWLEEIDRGAGRRPGDRSTTSSACRTCTGSCWRRCGSTRRRSGSSARRCRTSTSTGTWSRPATTSS